MSEESRFVIDLLERHRRVPTREEMLDRYVDKFKGRPLGAAFEGEAGADAEPGHEPSFDSGPVVDLQPQVRPPETGEEEEASPGLETAAIEAVEDPGALDDEGEHETSVEVPQEDQVPDEPDDDDLERTVIMDAPGEESGAEETEAATVDTTTDAPAPDNSTGPEEQAPKESAPKGTMVMGAIAEEAVPRPEDEPEPAEKKGRPGRKKKKKKKRSKRTRKSTD